MFFRLHIDTTPMRSRPFTLLLLSRTITRFGSIVTSTTILLHVARLLTRRWQPAALRPSSCSPSWCWACTADTWLTASTGAGSPSFLRLP